MTRVAAEGMLNLSRSGHLGMLTLTAPSPNEHDQWVIDWDRATPRPRCGCNEHLVHGMGWWNSTCSARWNVLRTALKRVWPDLEFFRAVEVQVRGALHLHIIVWTAKPLDLQRVQALALSAGFGCSVDWAPAKPGDLRQAGYASKYVTKSTDQRGETPWDVVDQDSGEVVAVDDARYRTWSSSRGWGVTMKMVETVIREAARARALHLRGLQPEPPAEALEVPAGVLLGASTVPP